MKKLLLIAIALGALFTNVACLDVTPYPVLDAGTSDDAVDADVAADAGSE